jgi:hypothetical protein
MSLRSAAWLGRALLLLALAVSPWRALAADAEASPAKAPYCRVDFSSYPVSTKSAVPEGWKYQGKWGVPDPSYFIVKDPVSGAQVLRLVSDKATGTLLYALVGKLDLNKTPIMRWKWKMGKLPAGADGRFSSKDDQALGIYLGTGRLLRDSVGYRWETETPIGAEGNATYARVVAARWQCVRNKDSALNTWFVEERNVAEDFKRAYGEIPVETVLTVSINSQYTGTQAESFLEYVEFVPLNAAKASGN